MSITQADIDGQLKQLEQLVTLVEALRRETQTLEQGMAEAQEQYDLLVGPIMRENDGLRAEIAALREALRPRRRQPLVLQTQPQGAQATTRAPQESRTAEPPASAEQPLKKDPRYRRKQALADYIVEFIDPGDGELMQRINALVADRQRVVGDMLELLSWGQIWRERSDSETIEQQHQRLGGWMEELRQRQSFWQGRIEELRQQSLRYSLWQERRSRDDQQWQEYLQREFGEGYRADTLKLREELATLKQLTTDDTSTD